MRTYNYTPELCRGKDSEYKGDVTYRLPKYTERKKLLVKYGISANAVGGVEFKNGAVEALIAMVEGAKEFVEKVDIERKSDKAKFKTYEDLEYDPACEPLLEDIARLLIGGSSLEKK